MPALTTVEIDRVFASFVGIIRQQPPMYSAVKIGGIPLYRLARKGIDVARQEREVTIFHLQVLAVELPFIRFYVECSKGTYVRTLCRDLGKALGSLAHLHALRRTRSGIFSLDDARSLEKLEEDGRLSQVKLLPLEEGIRKFPQLEVAPHACLLLEHGIPPQATAVNGAGNCREGELVALTREGRLAAMARFAPNRSQEKRGDFELLRVFTAP